MEVVFVVLSTEELGCSEINIGLSLGLTLQRSKACFHICHKDELVAVYAYCNLHGLWKA